MRSGEQSPDFSLLPYAFAFPYFEEGATRALNYAGVASYMAEALSLLFLDAYDNEAESAAALTEHFECMEGDVPDVVSDSTTCRHTEHALALADANKALPARHAFSTKCFIDYLID